MNQLPPFCVSSLANRDKIGAMTTSPDDIDLDALPADFKALLLAERAARKQLEIYAKRLEHLLAEFKRALFGRKSEKINANQLHLAFEELETALAEVETAKAAADAKRDGKAAGAKQTANRNIGHLPQDLPRIEQIIEPETTQCPCGCGEMVKIGEDRTERLDIVPAQLRVIVTIRPKYACSKVCDTKIVQAPAPAYLIEGALPSDALVAHVLVSKYADHLPLYRQAQIYSRSDIDLHRMRTVQRPRLACMAALHSRPLPFSSARRAKCCRQ